MYTPEAGGSGSASAKLAPREVSGVFSKLLELTLKWSRRPRASWYLGAVSFAESSFFPIPPDVLLAPMVLARPERAWRLATWTTVCSVAGGVLGFAIGALAIDAVAPLIERAGHGPAFAQAREWFGVYGFWAVLVAGFSPIPYKVFALAAGSMSMLLPAFVLASIAGRGGRFFLVAGLMAWAGESMERRLKRCIDVIGWSLVAVALLAYLVY